jgi:branched-chain amino acid transport system permease protein
MRFSGDRKSMFLQFVQQLVNGITIGMIYTLMAVGLTVIFGILRIGNFAQGEFYMLGAFVALYMVSSLFMNYLLSILMALVCVALLGVIVERLAIRPLQGRPHAALIVSTIGASIFLENMALILFGATPKTLPSPYARAQVVFWGIHLTEQRILILLMSVMIIVALHFFIKKTKTGMAMRAVAKDPDTASLMGINVNRVYAYAFAIGGGLAAVAGALLGAIFVVAPNMGNLMVIKAFVVLILGGMGYVPGAVFAGILLGVTESLGAGFISTEYKDVIGYGIMLLVLLFRPEGLFGKVGLK